MTPAFRSKLCHGCIMTNALASSSVSIACLALYAQSTLTGSQLNEQIKYGNKKEKELQKAAIDLLILILALHSRGNLSSKCHICRWTEKVIACILPKYKLSVRFGSNLIKFWEQIEAF